MTREPRVNDSLAFSAISRQQTTSKNDVASSHSWVWRFCHRRLTASPNVAVAAPEGVNRNSGSRVMLPIRVTLFPFDMVISRSVRVRGLPSPGYFGDGRATCSARHLLGQADDLVADHLVCEMQHPVELGHCGRLG